MPNSALDTDQFNRIARRNVTLPLVVGLVSAASFIGFFLYFMSVSSWVDHTHQVIGKMNELTTLEGDMEAAARGYLLTGDDVFLGPYAVARPQFAAQIDELVRSTADNPTQTDRLRKVQVLQQAWQDYAEKMIAAKRTGADIQPASRASTAARSPSACAARSSRRAPWRQRCSRIASTR